MASQDPLILARSAVVFIAAGEVELADSLAEQANRLDPNEINALIWGGFAKLFLGNHRAAMDHFQRALRQSPVDPRALYAQTGLAFTHFFLGDYDKGCKFAVEAVRDHPEVLIGLRAAMACHAFAGDVKAAREFYRRLAVLAPSERVSDLRTRNAYSREEDYQEVGGCVSDGRYARIAQSVALVAVARATNFRGRKSVCWHFSDMPTDTYNVRSLGQTGSGRARAKPTRLTKADISVASWQSAAQPNPPLPEGRSSPIRCPS